MKRKGEIAGVKFELSSGNVYADLGVPDADAMLVKSELIVEIMRTLRARKLTQAQAAEVVGLTQLKLSSSRAIGRLSLIVQAADGNRVQS